MIEPGVDWNLQPPRQTNRFQTEDPHMRHFADIAARCRYAAGGLVAILLLAGASAPATEPPATFPSAPGLGDYLDWSREHSPRLEGQAARADVLRAQADGAGALPRLRLAWGEMIVPVETRVGPQQRVLSISQSLPWFGTLGAREAGLAAAATAADDELRDLRWQVARDVRSAWYELAHLTGQIAIVSRNLALARQVEAVARTRYESGEAAYSAVLEAQMEIGRLESHRASLHDRRSPVTARLNAAAGLPPGTPPPPDPRLPDDLATAVLPARADLDNALRLGNPALASMRNMAESRRLGVAAADKRAYPDLTLGVDYIVTGSAAAPDVPDSGKDPVIARVALNIPLWGGQAGAERRAATGMLRAAREDLSDARLALTARLADAVYAWHDAGRNLELYGQTLLPRSAQNLTVTTAAYESGQVRFDRLLDVHQEHLGLELAELRARTERVLALNDLAALLGATPEDLVRGQLPGVAVPAVESD